MTVTRKDYLGVSLPRRLIQYKLDKLKEDTGASYSQIILDAVSEKYGEMKSKAGKIAQNIYTAPFLAMINDFLYKSFPVGCSV